MHKDLFNAATTIIISGHLNNKNDMAINTVNITQTHVAVCCRTQKAGVPLCGCINRKNNVIRVYICCENHLVA